MTKRKLFSGGVLLVVLAITVGAIVLAIVVIATTHYEYTSSDGAVHTANFCGTSFGKPYCQAEGGRVFDVESFRRVKND